MDNEEAKLLYHNAVKAFEANNFGAALAQFDRLDAHRPNSRHVMQYRLKCLVKEGQFEAAREIFSKLEGKIEPGKLNELRDMLAGARHAVSAGMNPTPVSSHSSASDIYSDPGSAGAVYPEGSNVFTIEGVFPVSTDETTVTGHVAAGIFRTGDQVSVLAPSGMPVTAAVLRLGKADTPVKIIRAGQQSVMLLGIEPQYCVPGAAITASSQEEAYAATMVVGSTPAAPSPAERTTALIEVERMIKKREYPEALERLHEYVGREPESGAGHRLLAQVYLEGDAGVKDQKKSLDHIRKAYELGGAEDPVVVYTLAQALASNGEADHGLRFLERLYGNTQDLSSRVALANRLSDYRDKHGLGHVWEFSDSYGEVVFEATSISEVAKALKSNSIPKDGLCRVDRVGDWRKIEETLAPQHSEIAVFYQQKKAAAAGGNNTLTIVIAVLAIAVVAAILWAVL
ncbi:MAG: hypothetical protein HYV27_12630 [Candidatus Hydrogenedentes bacterium]|nr:hypothetical protein [Candidatus Hydrogenedentota bacterium]